MDVLREVFRDQSSSRVVIVFAKVTRVPFVLTGELRLDAYARANVSEIGGESLESTDEVDEELAVRALYEGVLRALVSRDLAGRYRLSSS